jgi:hypothetical protein
LLGPESNPEMVPTVRLALNSVGTAEKEIRTADFAKWPFTNFVGELHLYVPLFFWGNGAVVKYRERRRLRCDSGTYRCCHSKIQTHPRRFRNTSAARHAKLFSDFSGIMAQTPQGP